MIWPIVFSAISVLVIYRLRKTDPKSDFFAALFMWIFISLMAGVLFAGAVGCFLPKKWVLHSSSTPLADLRQESQSTEGGHTFFMADSHDDLRYYYFQKTPSGHYVSRSLKTDEVVIIEEDRQDAEQRFYSQRFAQDYFWLFGVYDSVEFKEEFLVPRGAFKKKFVIE